MTPEKTVEIFISVLTEKEKGRLLEAARADKLCPANRHTDLNPRASYFFRGRY